METGRREEAQCQSGQLDGNKAVVDGDAVDPHAVKWCLPASALHIKRHTPAHSYNDLLPQSLALSAFHTRFRQDKIHTCMQLRMHKLFIGTGVPVVPVFVARGLEANCCSLKRSREREREGPHSADQMTSLLQLMFSGAQTQG